MCLAVPMKLIEKKGKIGVAEISGVKREVRLDFFPEAEIGDYIIIHAGFAIQKLDEKDAEETLLLFKEMFGGVDDE
ncbi:HypC/HybG/HupF family hydrogenase formation chaperone [candidate division WOR-3 bacterium]|nr:HypC/HybG/HupF family hydrogenase formation chaperone [candidate division WOR-3 bacterium]